MLPHHMRQARLLFKASLAGSSNDAYFMTVFCPAETSAWTMQETLGLSLDLVKPLPQLLQAALQEDAPISHTQCVFQLICHVQSADRQKAYRYACVCQVETTCNAYVMH